MTIVNSVVLQLIIFLHLYSFTSGGQEENEGVKYANKCEVCKIVTHELESRLQETGKVQEVIEIGYSLDDIKPKKKTHYKKSELRLVESLDKICDRILEYNIHKERDDSSRFARGMSQTFKTLHGLVDKGVKVDLGIPLELWDKPSVEITNMKTQCELMLEEFEEDIEDWYKGSQDKGLQQYLCVERVLDANNQACLAEPFEPLEKKSKKQRKGDIGRSTEQKKIDDEL
ncbi:protein canopy 4-like [Macrosteles quadrilineatus]|uniref:protein canopy 4-like n=1 Tax=Macrosteles quadrilineatus TaxID=74068 RepID=UPI0023E25A11|nr:protein canopy 4-like [Macrosteles quadrilineatus]